LTARGNSPTPKPTTKTVIVINPTSSLTWNSFVMPAISAVMTELAKATTKHVMATTMVQYHLYALLQFLGFSGSSGVKVTSLYCSLPGLGGPGISPLGTATTYSARFALALRVR